MKLNSLKKIIPILFILFFFHTINLSAEDQHIDEKYFHTHEGHAEPHDLTMAIIDFKTDIITDSKNQLQGKWALHSFQSTDHEMLSLVTRGQFRIWLNVYEDYLQVSVEMVSSGKLYQDPPVKYRIIEQVIVLDNEDFGIGLTGDNLVLTLVAMDQAYRYSFVRE